MTILSMLSKLRYGQHHALFLHGFPLTARLAWGCRLPKDPDLQTWLSDPALFERPKNGVVLFAPRLLARAVRLDGASTGRLKGIVRWRHAQNCYSYNETDKAIAALGTDTIMIVAAGWGDVSSGRATLASAHLARTFVAIKPYAPDRVSALLTQLGWTAEGPDWRQPKLPNGDGMVRISVGSHLGLVPWPDATDANDTLLHASGPCVTLLLAERVLTSKGENAGQLIERFVQELPDRRRISEAQAHADKTGQRPVFDQALALVEQLCGGTFEAQRPCHVEEKT